MAKKYRVTLTDEERQALEQQIARGKGGVHFHIPARILLPTDESSAGPAHDDVTVAEALTVSVRTIERVRQRFVVRRF